MNTQTKIVLFIAMSSLLTSVGCGSPFYAAEELAKVSESDAAVAMPDPVSEASAIAQDGGSEAAVEAASEQDAGQKQDANVTDAPVVSTDGSEPIEAQAADAMPEASTSSEAAAPLPEAGIPVEAGSPPPPTGCADGATIIAVPTVNPLSGVSGSGSFGTTGAVCVTYAATNIGIGGWNVTSAQGRTVIVTGSTTQTPVIPSSGATSEQPGLLPGADGYIYWNYSAGDVDYTNMVVY
jgi:hypothetical protein